MLMKSIKIVKCILWTPPPPFLPSNRAHLWAKLIREFLTRRSAKSC